MKDTGAMKTMIEEQERSKDMESVSIVVATYRRDRDLQNALESLAGQSYADIEIVLVDDNGEALWNDKVAAIVEAFRSQYPEIPLNYVVNPINQGSAKSRNIGIEAATGEYVTFLDDDDLYLPNKVENQLRFMLQGGYDYSVTDLSLCKDNGKEIEHRTRSYIKDNSVASLRKYHLMYHITGTDTIMLKKSYLTEIGGFPPINVGDEFYLVQRAIEGGGKFGYLPVCDVRAQVHTGEGGLSSGEGKIRGEKALHAYKKTFFHQLDKKSIRYICMRHHAVLAFAELRRKRYGACLCHAVKSFFCAPLASLKLLINRKF